MLSFQPDVHMGEHGGAAIPFGQIFRLQDNIFHMQIPFLTLEYNIPLKICFMKPKGNLNYKILICQAVAHAVYRFNINLLREPSDLLSQIADMHVHGVLIAHIFVPGNALEQIPF